MASFLLLGTPAAYIVLACLALNQFKIAYGLFTSFVNSRWANPIWKDTLQPLFQQVMVIFESTLGPVHKLSFDFTQILLTALILVIVVYGDRIKTAILSSRR